jgi:hypothetical protein
VGRTDVAPGDETERLLVGQPLTEEWQGARLALPSLGQAHCQERP